MLFHPTKTVSVDEWGREVEIEFTEEEAEAINRKLRLFSAAADAERPEGSETVVHRKFLDAIYAQGLTEYAKESILDIDDSKSDEALASTIGNAMKATMKAYIIHHLPIYLFQAAGMLELLGDSAAAKELFGRFVREQRAFEPDQVDSIFLKQAGLDVPKMIEIAIEKIR